MRPSQGDGTTFGPPTSGPTKSGPVKSVGTGLISGEAELDLGLPLVHVRLLLRVGLVDLQAAAPVLAVRLLRHVERQPLLRRPPAYHVDDAEELVRVAEVGLGDVA